MCVRERVRITYATHGATVTPTTERDYLFDVTPTLVTPARCSEPNSARENEDRCLADVAESRSGILPIGKAIARKNESANGQDASPLACASADPLALSNGALRAIQGVVKL